VQNLIYAGGVLALEPLPAWLPGHPGIAYLTGLMLLVCGVALVADKGVRPAAITLSALLGAWVLLLQLPPLIAAPRDGSLLTTTFETVALCGPALVLAGRAKVGRIFFGLSLPVFGFLHFRYYQYVASVIPGWVPGHLLWTYAIGVAFFAAGLSILTGVQARLTAILLGVMWGTWVLILHAPRAVAALHSRPEWTSLLIALALSGGSWIIAGGIAKRAPAEGSVS
jgi:hypothetical protein